MRITQDNSDLRRARSLLCELADLIDHRIRRLLKPRWRGATVGDGAGRNPLTIAVHASHLCGWWCCWSCCRRRGGVEVDRGRRRGGRRENFAMRAEMVCVRFPEKIWQSGTSFIGTSQSLVVEENKQNLVTSPYSNVFGPLTRQHRIFSVGGKLYERWHTLNVGRSANDITTCTMTLSKPQCFGRPSCICNILAPLAKH